MTFVPDNGADWMRSLEAISFQELENVGALEISVRPALDVTQVLAMCIILCTRHSECRY